MTTAKTYIFEGKESTLEELSEKHNIPVKTLERRLRHGISIEDAINNNDKLTKEANRDRLGSHAKIFNVNGVDMTAKEVQKKYGINAATFIRRVQRGMAPTTAAKTAVRKHTHGKNMSGKQTATKYEYQGEMFSVRELSEMSGICETTLRNRFAHGLTANEAIDNHEELMEKAKENRLANLQNRWPSSKKEAYTNGSGYPDPTAAKAIDNTESVDIPEPEVSNKLVIDGVEVHAGTIWKTNLDISPYVKGGMLCFVTYTNSIAAIVMRCLDMNEGGFDETHPNVNTDFIIDHYLVDPSHMCKIYEGSFLSLETYMSKDNTSHEAYLNLSAYCPELASSVIRSDQRMISMFRKQIDEYRAKIDKLEKNAPSEPQLGVSGPAEEIESLKGEIEILIAGGQQLAGENIDLEKRILEIEQQLKHSQLIVDAQIATYGLETVEHNVGRYVLEGRKGDSNESK